MSLLVSVLTVWLLLSVVVSAGVAAMMGRTATARPPLPRLAPRTLALPSPRRSLDAHAGLVDTR